MKTFEEAFGAKIAEVEAKWAEKEAAGEYVDRDTYEYGFGDYTGLLAGCVEILVQKDVGSYQGTGYALVRDGGRLGHVAWGYGSCSGCDWYHSVSKVDEMKKIFESLRDSIV